MFKWILSLTFIVALHAAYTFNKIMVEDQDAFCLDGTKPAYYVHKGDPHKFILSF